LLSRPEARMLFLSASRAVATRIFALRNPSIRSIFRMPEFRNWVPRGQQRAPTLVSVSMKQDPENGKDTKAGGSPGSASSTFLSAHGALVDRLFSESGASSWDLARETFNSALERSVRKQFACAPPPEKLEEYLGALHVQDLALACACAEGRTSAWDDFVGTYRSYLRHAAGAILKSPPNSPVACELADSLFADLYGVSSGKRADLSLFRYFHGRSSLKTWLRAILAQRHVDGIRAGRRFTELDPVDGAADASLLIQKAPHVEPPDPHRTRYVALLTAAFELALSKLDAEDRDRLRMYYTEQQTLAEIGRALGEHESSVSRSLERIRRGLRAHVEEALRKGAPCSNGAAPQPGLSDAQIALC